jgi:hypothetical protein
LAVQVQTNNEKQQIKLVKFCKEYDIPRTTALRWIHNENFPAYNLCGHWYVDVPKFYKWREEQNNKVK